MSTSMPVIDAPAPTASLRVGAAFPKFSDLNGHLQGSRTRVQMALAINALVPTAANQIAKLMLLDRLSPLALIPYGVAAIPLAVSAGTAATGSSAAASPGISPRRATAKGWTTLSCGRSTTSSG